MDQLSSTPSQNCPSANCTVKPYNTALQAPRKIANGRPGRCTHGDYSVACDIYVYSLDLRGLQMCIWRTAHGDTGLSVGNDGRNLARLTPPQRVATDMHTGRSLYRMWTVILIAPIPTASPTAHAHIWDRRVRLLSPEMQL